VSTTSSSLRRRDVLCAFMGLMWHLRIDFTSY
jgi:hypothetical protein